MEFVIENGKLLEVRNPDQDVHIPEGVTGVAPYLFDSLEETKNIWFPASLVNCNEHVFFKHQENVFVHSDNPVFASHDGVLYDKNQTLLIRCPWKKHGIYKLAPTTKTISTDAFCCSALDEIILNDGLETIEKYAFNGRTDKKGIFIPRSVKSIDARAFTGEWTCQRIIVLKDSYAYQWARIHHERLYECADFDEAADLQRRLK